MRRAVFLIPMLCWSLAAAQDVPEPAVVESYFQDLADSFAKQDVDRCLRAYAEDFEADFGIVTKVTIRERLDRTFKESEGTEFLARIHRVDKAASFLIATVSTETRVRGGDGETQVHEDSIWILERDGTRLQARNRFSIDLHAQKRLTARRYESPVGGYSLTRPEGWVLFIPRGALEQTFDLAWLYNPSTESIAGVAVVDLPPRPVNARDLAQIENINIEREGAKVMSFQATSIDSVDAWQTELYSPIGSREAFVRKLHVVRERLYYTVYFQSTSKQVFLEDGVAFDSMLESFRFDDANVPRPGTIEGDRFRMDSPACEILKPDGWTMALGASRDLFRVFVTPKQTTNETRVVFFAQKYDGFGSAEDSIERLARSLQACIPGTEKYGEVRPIRAHGIEGREVVLRIPAASMARIRKIALFKHERTLYIFYCDAIPPDSYKALEPTFNDIIASFKVGE